MLDLILLPFKVAFDIICAVFEFIGGLFSLVFGILGGVLSLAVSLGSFVLVIGLIALVIHRRKEYKARQEDFTSFYDREGRVE